MHTYQSAFTSRPVPVAVTPTLLGATIQVLDIKKDCFYGASPKTENGPLVILPTAVKPDNIPSIRACDYEGLASSIFKSSVVFMYTDKRGIYLDYHAPNNSKDKMLALFVEWKEVGVQNPSQSDFDLFLCYLKKGMLEKHFITILAQGNKARKAIFKAIDSIAFSMYERYNIGNNCRIETGYHGGWDLVDNLKIIRHAVCLEQLTLKLVKH